MKLHDNTVLKKDIEVVKPIPKIKQLNEQVPLHHERPHLLRNVGIIIAIMLVLSYLLYLRVVQVEVDKQITVANNELTEMKSEYIRLQMEVENSQTLTMFEQEAQRKYGLQKQNDQQLKYVDLHEKNKILLFE